MNQITRSTFDTENMCSIIIPAHAANVARSFSRPTMEPTTEQVMHWTRLRWGNSWGKTGSYVGVTKGDMGLVRKYAEKGTVA